MLWIRVGSKTVLLWKRVDMTEINVDLLIRLNVEALDLLVCQFEFVLGDDQEEFGDNIAFVFKGEVENADKRLVGDKGEGADLFAYVKVGVGAVVVKLCIITEAKRLSYLNPGIEQLRKLLKSINDAPGHIIDAIDIPERVTENTGRDNVIWIGSSGLLFLGKKGVCFQGSHRGKGDDTLIGLFTTQKQRDGGDSSVPYLSFDAVGDRF